jgi:uncharacterized protein (DUF697 family)
MALSVLKDIRKIIAALDANEIRGLSAQDINVGLVAASDSAFRKMEDFLAPPMLGSVARAQVLRSVRSVDGAPRNYDFVLVEPGQLLPLNGHIFEPGNEDSLITRIVSRHEKLELALARTFPRFRPAVASRVIGRVARENALFSIVTALPNVVPNLLELPWAVGEFATDTAFLTTNQIRMALLLAAAHGQPVGYMEQKTQIAGIVAGAFGWRAIARELVGKIPLGGGLIPKAAVAFAGTYVVGLGLDKLNRTGDRLSRQERRDAYADAFVTGKQVVRELAPGLHQTGPNHGGGDSSAD